MLPAHRFVLAESSDFFKTMLEASSGPQMIHIAIVRSLSLFLGGWYQREGLS